MFNLTQEQQGCFPKTLHCFAFLLAMCEGSCVPHPHPHQFLPLLLTAVILVQRGISVLMCTSLMLMKLRICSCAFQLFMCLPGEMPI
jgi:hypothetical protein